MTVLDNFRANRGAAVCMPPEDIANIVNRAMSSKDVVNQHMDVLGNYLEQLQEILDEARQYMEKFTQRNF
jgi:hypothetical protein